MRVEVRPAIEFESYWSAVAWVDGVRTSFGCPHNHKTELAASKCVDKVHQSAVEFLYHPDFTDTIIDLGAEDSAERGVLHEWRTGGYGYVSCRVRYRK